MTDFTFEQSDVDAETKGAVLSRLERGASCLVLGRWGSGKSCAVRCAVNGAVWIDLDHGALQQTRFCVDAARQLCDAVNDRTTFDPADAEKVFRAHRVYTRIGDIEQARRTARLHVAGLVDVARRVSVAGGFSDARNLHNAVIDMLDEMEGPGATSLQHLRSYVVHYRAHNGRRAGLTPGADALDAYRTAVDPWSENALWHGRLIGLLVELTRLEEAQAALERAYGAEGVPDHPRRDGCLRVGPAWSALEHGVGDFGLGLIEPLIGRLNDRDPEGAASIEELLDRWRRGAKVETLRQ